MLTVFSGVWKGSEQNSNGGACDSPNHHCHQEYMKFLLGTKEKMTQIFDDQGVVHPVTVVKAGPVVVTQVKTLEKDGYDAVQVGYGERQKKRIAKAQLGHTKDVPFRHMKEYRISADVIDVAVGDSIDLGVFEIGQIVETISTSKGKGFQGVVKRHMFEGGRRSHGQKHSEREAGSIGGGGRAGGRVIKGMRMAGRMGGDRVTQINVKIIGVNKETNEIYLSGGIPGRRGSLVEIRG